MTLVEKPAPEDVSNVRVQRTGEIGQGFRQEFGGRVSRQFAGRLIHGDVAAVAIGDEHRVLDRVDRLPQRAEIAAALNRLMQKRNGRAVRCWFRRPQAPQGTGRPGPTQAVVTPSQPLEVEAGVLDTHVRELEAPRITVRSSAGVSFPPMRRLGVLSAAFLLAMASACKRADAPPVSPSPAPAFADVTGIWSVRYRVLECGSTESVCHAALGSTADVTLRLEQRGGEMAGLFTAAQGSLTRAVVVPLAGQLLEAGVIQLAGTSPGAGFNPIDW